MNNKVKFLRGTSNEYAVAEKDSDTIYFTTDDGKLYIGDKEVSGDGSITIDTTLSDTSENPVQNKVIKQAIDNKADKTTATTTADGLMSAEDKSKLDGIATGAKAGTVTNVVITATSPLAVNSTAAITSSGTRTISHLNSGVTAATYGTNKTTALTPKFGDAFIVNGFEVNASGHITSATSHTVKMPNAVFTKSGSGAAVGLVPAPSTTAGTTKYLREDGTWQVPPDNNTTYNNATTSSAGLMSAEDKSKLDGIATGANKTVIDTALSSTSTNPVQNKIVNSALDNKVDKTSAVFSTYNSVTNFGVTNASSPNDIWAAIPNNSIVIVTASTFTHPDWNFPSGYHESATVVFVKVNRNRLGGIYLVPKTGGYIYWSNVGSDGSYNANWRALMNGRIDKGQASLKAGTTKCTTNHNFEFFYCLYWTSSAKFDGNYAALISVVGDTTSFTINSAYSEDRTIGYIIYGN